MCPVPTNEEINDLDCKYDYLHMPLFALYCDEKDRFIFYFTFIM